MVRISIFIVESLWVYMGSHFYVASIAVIIATLRNTLVVSSDLTKCTIPRDYSEQLR